MYATETNGVIRSKLPDLRRLKEYNEGRNIPLREIADKTDLALNTVQRLMSGDIDRVYISTLNKFCAYFGVGTGELIEYVPDEGAQP